MLLREEARVGFEEEGPDCDHLLHGLDFRVGVRKEFVADTQTIEASLAQSNS